MRLTLPASVGALLDGLKAKVRNQVKKGQQQGFSVAWGGAELLGDFYAVFSTNMRDLGTPVYGRRLFEAILGHFGPAAELCVVRDGQRPIAGGLLVHGGAVTEVPSASSLKAYNPTNANMLLYWHLLSRAVERGQQVFDVGRSTAEGPVYRFKKQWGAEPSSAIWQYHVRHGSIDVARPDNPRHQRLIRLWKRLPVWASRILGPRIVRGIP
jgi:FemAB-related protein (PEP-CTERM system-associated)